MAKHFSPFFRFSLHFYVLCGIYPVVVLSRLRRLQKTKGANPRCDTLDSPPKRNGTLNQMISGPSGSGSGSGSGSVGSSEAGGVVGFDSSLGLGFVPAFTRESVSCS